MIIGLIGTTITPWMQFYLQASIVEKGISKRNYNLSRIDVIFGCVVTDVIAFFIVVAGIVAKSGSGSGRVRRAHHRVQSLQVASLSWRYHSLVRAVVPEVSDLLPTWPR